VSHKKQAEKNQAWEIICRLATPWYLVFRKTVMQHILLDVFFRNL